MANKKYNICSRVGERVHEALEEKRVKGGFEKMALVVRTILKEYFGIKPIKSNNCNKSIKRNTLSKKTIVLDEDCAYNTKIIYKGKAYLKSEGKICSKCGEWKPFSHFYKDSSKKKQVDGFGYMSQCKDCKEGR